jgi:hypothetical protein
MSISQSKKMEYLYKGFRMGGRRYKALIDKIPLTACCQAQSHCPDIRPFLESYLDIRLGLEGTA